MAFANDGPAAVAAAVTPHDTNLIDMTRGLYVGGAGDVTVRMRNGSNCTFTGVPAGSILPVQCDRVLSTGTTATNIVRLG
jgi:hypothetical protein